VANARPNPLLCALGFGAAGTGFGSLAGTWYSGYVWNAMPPAEQELTHSMIVGYEWLWKGVAVGFILGAAVGIMYALSRRRIGAKRGP
jgi:hypothetical protein